ncbi:MAG TPA: hypothetical protein VF838_18880 [Trebonia sp.]
MATKAASGRAAGGSRLDRRKARTRQALIDAASASTPWTCRAAWYRALRDIQVGRAAGRFAVPDAEIALSAVAGGLLGVLRLHQRNPERVQESAVDQLAEAVLRLLGVPVAEAAALAALPLPDASTW